MRLSIRPGWWKETERKAIHELHALPYTRPNQSPRTIVTTVSAAVNNPLAADLVVIDESSIIDVYLFHSLLKAMAPQARLFFVGDVDQLPSVGPGNVLTDLISSGPVPVVGLKTVFRQAAESGIIANAHRINQGQFPKFNPEDLFVLERRDPGQPLATLVEVVAERFPAKYGLDPKQDIHVLAPIHRDDVGVTRLNESFQAVLHLLFFTSQTSAIWQPRPEPPLPGC